MNYIVHIVRELTGSTISFILYVAPNTDVLEEIDNYIVSTYGEPWGLQYFYEGCEQ